jgi:hypothetical protein
MSLIARIRVTWSGTPVVGPGVSTFYLGDSVSAGWPAALVTLYTAMKNYVPTGVTWTIPNVVDILESTTGELSSANTPGGGGSVLSSGGAVDYKPGVGGRLRWGTSGVVGGRRVTGTTFLVPMTSQETPNGVIQGTTVANLQTAMAAYYGSTTFNPVVYSRHLPARVVGGVSYPERMGSVHDITSASVPSAITWLRSRRT